mgnify:CR=1 FL=1
MALAPLFVMVTFSMSKLLVWLPYAPMIMPCANGELISICWRVTPILVAYPPLSIKMAALLLLLIYRFFNIRLSQLVACMAWV